MSDIDSMLLLYISYLSSFSRFIHVTLLKNEYHVGLVPFRSFTAKIWENGVLLMTTDFNLRTC